MWHRQAQSMEYAKTAALYSMESYKLESLRGNKGPIVHPRCSTSLEKSHEKGLTTKEHIVLHTHLNFSALHLWLLAINLFNNGTKFF